MLKIHLKLVHATPLSATLLATVITPSESVRVFKPTFQERGKYFKHLYETTTEMQSTLSRRLSMSLLTIYRVGHGFLPVKAGRC